MAEERGISTRYLRQQMAEERERERVAAEIRASRGDYLEPYDFEYMELVEKPGSTVHEWCKLEPEGQDDREAVSSDAGRYHVGGRVRSVNGGREAEEPTRQHKPDPDGLRGGKD